MSENSVITYKLGQVGGFPLRLSWLPRLVICGKPLSSSDSEQTSLQMGIGKNMVKALRLWALAAGIISDQGILTERAERLFSPHCGRDKYAEEDETLWLLHWLICSNLDCFTANGWLLNFFYSRSFTLKEAQEAFYAHLVDCQKRPYALGTIRVDLETAIRMYAIVDDKNKQSDIDDRCFRMMRLLSANRVGGEMRYARFFREEQPRLNDRVVTYAVIDSICKRGTGSASFSDLYAADYFPAPGVVFGLTKDGFLTALERAADSSKMFTLQSMPDGDFQVQIKNKYVNMAKKGNMLVADYFYFSSK